MGSILLSMLRACARLALYATILYVWLSVPECRWLRAILLILLLAFKGLQIFAGISWLSSHGETAADYFRRMEDSLASAPSDHRDAELRRVVFDYFRHTEPRYALLGIRDWRIRDTHVRAPIVLGIVICILHDVFFRFTTLSVFGSMVLLGIVRPMYPSQPDYPLAVIWFAIASLLMTNCFLMAGEVLFGNALMRTRGISTASRAFLTGRLVEGNSTNSPTSRHWH